MCKQSSQGQVRFQPNSVGIDDQARRDDREFPKVVWGTRTVGLIEPASVVVDGGGSAEALTGTGLVRCTPTMFVIQWH